MQREAGNCIIQGTVADAMNCAVRNFGCHEDRYKYDYKVLMQIHDALIFRIKIEHLEPVLQKIIPQCMVERVQVPGTPIKYSLGGFDIMKRWGEELNDDQLLELGINLQVDA